MLKLFTKADTMLDVGMRWGGAFVLAWGTLSWVASNLTWLGNLNWAESVFVGLGAAVLLSVAVSIALVAVRYFRPLPTIATEEGDEHQITALGYRLGYEWDEMQDNISKLKIAKEASEREVKGVIQQCEIIASKIDHVSSLEARLTEQIETLNNATRSYMEGAAAGFADRLKEHRSWIAENESRIQTLQWSLTAIWHRERMLELSEEADQISQPMIASLIQGNVLDLDEWHNWRVQMQRWQSTISSWSTFAQFYLGSDPMLEIKRIDAEKFDEEVGVRHHQIPDPEGLRVFKTFCIYYNNWMNLRAVIHNLVRRQAFEGQLTYKGSSDDQG